MHEQMKEIPTTSAGDNVNVVYVLKRNAKIAKSSLQKCGILHKAFRMVGVQDGIILEQDGVQARECIAIPVDQSIVDGLDNDVVEWKQHVLQHGTQFCPFSTSILGNRGTMLNVKNINLPLVHQTILGMSATNEQQQDNESDQEQLIQELRAFDVSVCPSKLEIFGDDRTIVLPPGAFLDNDFQSFLCSKIMHFEDTPEQRLVATENLWKSLLKVYSSSRIARRGHVNAESRIRHSGHRLVWPIAGIPDSTGPNSPGWICVTEQGIRQSLDLTRVMFSRGNISEKIRFGKLVCEGDAVLDLYAGIGYYTLPAIIHGKASHVTACEWNDDAIAALKFNIQDNKIGNKVTVLQGDCRIIAREHKLVDMFDRVSLGLLPSSEGGWRSAVHALKVDRGGWLHVHANVPEKECHTWLDWLCQSLLVIAEEAHRPAEWIVMCRHLEKVKSFAPTISHYVADVFVGPKRCIPEISTMMVDNPNSDRAFVVSRDCTITPCKPSVQPPSCALSSSGVLRQTWMSQELPASDV